MTAFAGLVQDYVRAERPVAGVPPGRMVALVGDAEPRRGQRVRGTARRMEARPSQRLVGSSTTTARASDAITPDRLYPAHREPGSATWTGRLTLKYGRLLEQAFARARRRCAARLD